MAIEKYLFWLQKEEENKGLLVDPNYVKEVIYLGSTDLIIFEDLEYNAENKTMLEKLLPELIELEKQVIQNNYEEYGVYLDTIEKMVGSTISDACGFEDSEDLLCYLSIGEKNVGSIHNLKDFKIVKMIVETNILGIKEFMDVETVLERFIEFDTDDIDVVRDWNSYGRRIISVPIIRVDGEEVADNILLVLEDCLLDFSLAEILYKSELMTKISDLKNNIC